MWRVSPCRQNCRRPWAASGNSSFMPGWWTPAPRSRRTPARASPGTRCTVARQAAALPGIRHWYVPAACTSSLRACSCRLGNGAITGRHGRPPTGCKTWTDCSPKPGYPLRNCCRCLPNYRPRTPLAGYCWMWCSTPVTAVWWAPSAGGCGSRPGAGWRSMIHNRAKAALPAGWWTVHRCGSADVAPASGC